ncbi:hypothetical protein B0H14DRAFT_3485292 [Mycena olivaceomarginata]|nr:hypothetical protein B0H14DRAFT_3485292 [Mycena olivaceomarginata]
MRKWSPDFCLVAPSTPSPTSSRHGWPPRTDEFPTHSSNRKLMYSTSIPYTTIKPVRAALTSFATQIIGKKVACEAECAVQISSGLHVSIGTKSKHPETQLQRHHIGAGTIPHVRAVIEKQQPVTIFLCNNIAMRRPRTRAGVVLIRKTRPPEMVVTHAIAAMNFCRSDNANLLPLARGILYFGSSAPVELMNYNCRIGSMPAPQTIRRSMITLSEDEAKVTREHGSDPETVGFLNVDNCQNYHRQNDLRIGRESVMNVGMAGLYFEAPDVNPDVFDLTDKRAYIALGLRELVTTDDLLGLVDPADSEVVGSLLFLETLARLIPALHSLRAEIRLRRGATATHVVPEGQAVVHPLASNGKKETIPTELKDGMLDFLAQIGQTPAKFLKRKLPVGGDGLTYAMLLQLQVYLQFHNDPFKSFEIFEPQLQVLAYKVDRHHPHIPDALGPYLRQKYKPSFLGVEFYQGSQLLNVVLDAKLLNIWGLAFKTDDIFVHFETLEKTKTLPDMETLLPMARKLYRAYATARGRDHALYDVGETNPGDTHPKKTRKRKEKPPPKRYEGDFVLAQEIDFLRDAINSRKLATAVAEGDIGRLYECIKYMLFTFAGSSHSNYRGYILETIMNFEYESSPGLKLALLRGLVWNLTGIKDRCEEGDFIVEFFNRLLEDVVEHKSAQFDDTFIRDIISRNLRHIALLKLAWRTGTGLEPKSSKHTNATEKPEVRTLYKLYKDVELHRRRPRRQVDDRDTDDFARGVKKLREGALQAAITKTLFERQVQRTDTPTTPPIVVDTDVDADGQSDSEESTSGSESESDEDSESDDGGGINFATRGSTYMVDGELVFDDRDMMLGPDDFDEYADFIEPPVEEEDQEDDGGLYEDPGGSEDGD